MDDIFLYFIYHFNPHFHHHFIDHFLSLILDRFCYVEGITDVLIQVKHIS